MPNSLLTGISGLRGHQKMLEVVGNNLANLNTTAFKASHVVFSDLIYQTQRSATSSSAVVASRNPVQIGTGSSVSQVARSFQQGNLEVTNSQLDMAIDGGGFFVGMAGGRDVFTRAGSFTLDENGYLSDPSTGSLIKRFGAVGEPDGVNISFQASGDNRIYIPIGAGIPGRVTNAVSVSGNFYSRSTGPVSQSLTSSAPFLVGGVAASSLTLLNDLDDNTVDYVAGDKILIDGRDPNGSAPSPTELTVTATTTVGDLIAALNTSFTGATVTLDSSGNVVATDNATGPSLLRVSFADAGSNIGRTNFDDHEMVVTDIGKDADVESRTVEVYDVSGTSHSVSLTFTKLADGTWNMKATLPPGEGVVLDGDVEGITFGEDGSFDHVAGTGTGDANITVQFRGLSAPQTMDIALGTPGSLDGLTEMGLATSLAVRADGSAPGKLTEVQVDTDGTIVGVASNGIGIQLAQLSIASFRNPDGLMSIGDNYYQASLASGDPEYGPALSGSRGQVRAGQLEGSNVDLALEFTRLIIAQRGFSANARTITVTDQVLQELNNLIR